jgi:hypothetical protein
MGQELKTLVFLSLGTHGLASSVPPFHTGDDQARDCPLKKCAYSVKIFMNSQAQAGFSTKASIMKIGLLFIAAFAVLVPAYSPVCGQYIYYSGCQGRCEFDHCGGYTGSMNVYVFSPGGQNIEGAHFRLDVGFGPEHVDSMVPGDGVTIKGGNPFLGMVLSWAPMELDHVPIFRLYSNTPLFTWENWVRDAMLFQTNGDTLFLADFPTYGGHFDCFDVSFNFWPPIRQKLSSILPSSWRFSAP